MRVPLSAMFRVLSSNTLRAMALAVAVLATAGSAAAQSTVPAPDPAYRVTLGGTIGGVPQGTVDAFIAKYGQPDSSGSEDTPNCRLTWDAIGLTMWTSTFGDEGADPCTTGQFLRADLLGPVWWMKGGGLTLGSPSSAIAERAKHRCRANECINFDVNYTPFRNGFVLSTHRIECAPGRFPTVIARTAKKKLSGFVVNWTGCE